MIQTGLVGLGYSATPGWNLNVGSGERSFISTDVPFDPPFASPPKVALALGGVDSGHDRNLRIILTPHDVDVREFNIRINTWGDTMIFQVWVTWIAFD